MKSKFKIFSLLILGVSTLALSYKLWGKYLSNLLAEIEKLDLQEDEDSDFE
jgi:hypothetical protein